MLKINKILFPIDFTENSLKILPYMTSVAETYKSMICLLHVAPDVNYWGIQYLPPYPPLEEAQKKILESAEKTMDDVCEKHLKSYPDLQRKIVSGEPSYEILKTIDFENVDLVIIGTHGRKGLDTIFGSVAENVLKNSSVPVLSINPYKSKKTDWKINKILFPIDFTENISKILPYVLWASENFKSAICLVHVIDDTFKFGQAYSLAWDKKKIAKEAENAMDKICEKELQGCPNFQRKIVFGDPGPTILKTIESENIDLVIMGTHGRRGLEHTLFGSVAENVVKRSTVPVLTINPYTYK